MHVFQSLALDKVDRKMIVRPVNGTAREFSEEGDSSVASIPQQAMTK
jgi:hypothetical protein